MKEFQVHIKDKFKDKGLKKVATKEVGKKTLWVASPLDSQIKIILDLIGREQFLDNQKSKDKLGMKYERDLLFSMEEMIETMLEYKILDNTPKKSKCVIF